MVNLKNFTKSQIITHLEACTLSMNEFKADIIKFQKLRGSNTSTNYRSFRILNESLDQSKRWFHYYQKEIKACEAALVELEHLYNN